MTAITVNRPTTFPRLDLRGGPSVRTSVRWDRVALLLAVLLAAVWVISGGVGPSQAVTPPADPVVVVVQPGDTLWDLARDHAPAGMATLEYVMLVEQVNDVRAGRLLPGTPLQLPQS